MSRLFNKSNKDYLDGGDIVKIIGNKITVSCWLKLNDANGEHKLVSKWADVGPKYQYLMGITDAEKLQFVVHIGYARIAIGSTTISTGSWHNLIGRYNGSNVRCYIDGIQDGSSNQTGNIDSATNAHLVLGAGSSGSGSEAPLDGCLGHTAIWNVALTDSEIESLASGINPMQIRPNDLVFYAPLNGQNPEPDIIGSNNLTAKGTTVADEPPISRCVKAP